MQVDLKIATKCIATRIKQVLPSIINADQTGYIPNRYIGENIRKLIELMIYCEETDIPSIFIIIDYEKAFDRLSHECIKTVLSFFNFGPMFQQWILTFYKNITSTIVNNGWTSKYFSIKQGIRQGCPLSGYIFVLCAEILAITIRKNNKINGILIGETEIKIQQYVDDTSLTLLANPECLFETIDVFNKFKQFSNLKVNYDKTEILRVGTLSNTDYHIPTISPLKWTNGPINVLGIVLSTKILEIENLNYTKKIKDVYTVLKIWQSRNLSIMGKICVINSLAISKLMYLASVLGTPDGSVLAGVHKAMFAFIWNNKPDQIKRDILFKNTEDGGLGLKNLPLMFKSLKVTWVNRLSKMSPTHPLSILVNRQLRHVGGDLIWQCTTSVSDVEQYKISSLFVKQMVLAVAELEIDHPLQQTVLWNNKYIRVANKTQYRNHWKEKGVVYLLDLFQNGSPISFETMQQRYHIVDNYLSYMSLISAIPRRWRRLVFEHTSNIYLCNVTGNSVCKHPKQIPSSCKAVYSIYISSSPSKCIKLIQNKWCDELNIDNNINWTSVYCNNFSCSISSKYRAFQYKFLARAITTNIKLLKCNIIDSDLCTFCKKSKESVIHLFWYCECVQSLWQSLLTLLNMKNINFDMNMSDILLGTSASQLVNFLYLITKQFIYFCSM